MDIFFVNKIPFLIILIRKIDFTATSHLPTQTARDILKYFWRIYVFDLICGFKTRTVNVDVEFYPLRELIAEMSSGLTVNLTSANKHVPETKQRIWVVY